MGPDPSSGVDSKAKTFDRLDQVSSNESALLGVEPSPACPRNNTGSGPGTCNVTAQFVAPQYPQIPTDQYDGGAGLSLYDELYEWLVVERGILPGPLEPFADADLSFDPPSQVAWAPTTPSTATSATTTGAGTTLRRSAPSLHAIDHQEIAIEYLEGGQSETFACPYADAGCNIRLRRSYDRKRHCESIHGEAEDMFQCRDCPWESSRKDSKKKHERNNGHRCEKVRVTNLPRHGSEGE